MKFIIELTFYKNDENINFSDIPDTIQNEILSSFTTTKFKKYLEKNISDMGSVCKNKVSHYLKFKIHKIKPIKSQSFLYFFGNNSVNLEIEANASQIKKKVVSEQWCGKKLNTKEIIDLFNDDNLIDHIDTTVKQLKSAEPFKKFDKKYYFYFKSASLF
jgi:Zn/Cd-binding protein ZinT